MAKTAYVQRSCGLASADNRNFKYSYVSFVNVKKCPVSALEKRINEVKAWAA